MPKILDDSMGAIGSFMESMLSEVDFQALYGSGWIIADNRNVSGSKYHTITTNTTVPDARGLVLRGKNNGRSTATGNTGGDLALGNTQTDSFKSHNHGGGSHTHNIQPFISANTVFGGGSSGTEWRSDTPSATHPTNGPNSTVIATEGDTTNGGETRMRNLTVNIFIRIN